MSRLFIMLVLSTFLGFMMPQITHDIYISVLAITIHSKSNTATVTAKVDAEDLRDALHNHFSKQQFKVDNTLCTSSVALTKYFNQYINCHIDGKLQPLKYQSCKLNGNIFEIQFTMTSPEQCKTFKIKASYLMELFAKQSHIINLQYKEKRFYKRLLKGQEEVEWTLKK